MKKKSANHSANHSAIVLDIEMHSRKTKLFQACLIVLFSVIALLYLVPLLWIFLSAFKSTEEFLSVKPTLFPKEISLSKMWDVWQRGKLLSKYGNTIIMSLGNIVFTLLFCGLAGYSLSRIKPTGTKLVMSVVFWSMMMPGNLAMVPLFINFTKGIFGIKLMNSFLPIWLMSAANAFYVLIFKSFFDGIPNSLIEAARIDGASEFTIFMRIVLPLSRPAVFTISIFTFTGSWGSFLWPSLILSDEKQVLGMAIVKQAQYMLVDEYFMLLLFAILPPVLFFIFFQKYIMDGYTIGGVKG